MAQRTCAASCIDAAPPVLRIGKQRTMNRICCRSYHDMLRRLVELCDILYIPAISILHVATGHAEAKPIADPPSAVGSANSTG